MAMAMEMNEEDEEQEQDSAPSWDTCPSEILLLIFEKMDIPTLITCMYVNSKWKPLVDHVVEHHKRWHEIVDTAIISKGNELKQKSVVSLTDRQIFHNYIQWNNLNRSNINLHQAQKVNNIIRINIYRDNLIVVSYSNVCYYHAPTLNLLKKVDLTCCDFLENDHMIVTVQDNYDKFINLQLFIKASPNDFNLDRSNILYYVDKVLLYRIENNRCYVLNYRNNLFVYAISYPDWHMFFTARYYGNPFESCALNVFEKEVYLMLKCGSIMWADTKLRCFKKILEIPTPLYEKSLTISCKMFHRFGFVFGVGVNEPVCVERYGIQGYNVFLYEFPKLSCVVQHGDILILGYLDGMIEFIMPRDLSKTEPQRRFHLRDFKKDTEDVKVISIDVYEDKGFQHLFIATNSDIFHLHITHPNCDDYMWKEYKHLVNLELDPGINELENK